jgi:hypothetical protein
VLAKSLLEQLRLVGFWYQIDDQEEQPGRERSTKKRLDGREGRIGVGAAIAARGQAKQPPDQAEEAIRCCLDTGPFGGAGAGREKLSGEGSAGA